MRNALLIASLLAATVGGASLALAQSTEAPEAVAPQVTTEAPSLSAPAAPADAAPVVGSEAPVAPLTTTPETAAPTTTAPVAADAAPEAQPTTAEPAAPEAPAAATAAGEAPSIAEPAGAEVETGFSGERRGGHERGHRGAREGHGAPAPEAAGGHAMPNSFDLMPLYHDAHIVVKAVMLGLAIAAFLSVTILIQKLGEYAFAFARLKKTARALVAAGDLASARRSTANHKGPGAEMIRAADDEMVLAQKEPALLPGVHDRSEGALVRIEAGAAQRLRSATGLLASIGSLSPFVGLFGTVFGIMNSFLAIAETKTTSLAVVAPGIAEALLATAIGLVAAIPAVLIYNICSRRLSKFRNHLNDVGAAVLRLQSREIDRLAAQIKEA